jgi:hypothetical protein
VCIYPSKGSALAQVHPHNTYQTNKYYWLYEAKALDRNSRVSSRTFGYYKYTTGLSFAEEGLGHLLQLLLLSFTYSHFIYSYCQLPLKTCLLVFTVIP